MSVKPWKPSKRTLYIVCRPRKLLKTTRGCEISLWSLLTDESSNWISLPMVRALLLWLLAPRDFSYLSIFVFSLNALITDMTRFDCTIKPSSHSNCGLLSRICWRPVMMLETLSKNLTASWYSLFEPPLSFKAFPILTNSFTPATTSPTDHPKDMGAEFRILFGLECHGNILKENSLLQPRP